MLDAAHTNRLMRSPRYRIRPLVAVRALRNLARSQGKELTQGVAFLRATEGQSARRAFDRFRATPLGRDVLVRQNFVARSPSES